VSGLLLFNLLGVLRIQECQQDLDVVFALSVWSLVGEISWLQDPVPARKIAGGVASALEDIGVEMAYSKDMLAALRSRTSVASIDKLVRIVAQLCTKIFRCLLPYLRWGQSSWERVKGSVDKDYLEKNI